MLEWIRFFIAAILMIAGLFFVVSSLVGVCRFRYVLNRMHAAALGDTLGIMLVLLGLAVISGFCFTTLKILLLVVVWWLTSPVASHMIGRLVVTIQENLESEMEVLTEEDPHREVDT